MLKGALVEDLECCMLGLKHKVLTCYQQGDDAQQLCARVCADI